MAELIERELLMHGLSQHLVQGLVIGDENLNEAMKGIDSSAFLHGFEYAMNLAQTIVSNQPTAYDVEKVVEQIKDYFFKVIVNCEEENISHEILEYNKAICEIVRRGGVE